MSFGSSSTSSFRPLLRESGSSSTTTAAPATTTSSYTSGKFTRYSTPPSFTTFTSSSNSSRNKNNPSPSRFLDHCPPHQYANYRSEAQPLQQQAHRQQQHGVLIDSDEDGVSGQANGNEHYNNRGGDNEQSEQNEQLEEVAVISSSAVGVKLTTATASSTLYGGGPSFVSSTTSSVAGETVATTINGPRTFTSSIAGRGATSSFSGTCYPSTSKFTNDRSNNENRDREHSKNIAEDENIMTDQSKQALIETVASKLSQHQQQQSLNAQGGRTQGGLTVGQGAAGPASGPSGSVSLSPSTRNGLGSEKKDSRKKPRGSMAGKFHTHEMKDRAKVCIEDYRHVPHACMFENPIIHDNDQMFRMSILHRVYQPWPRGFRNGNLKKDSRTAAQRDPKGI